jgi:hypothetical protein
MPPRMLPKMSKMLGLEVVGAGGALVGAGVAGGAGVAMITTGGEVAGGGNGGATGGVRGTTSFNPGQYDS